MLARRPMLRLLCLVALAGPSLAGELPKTDADLARPRRSEEALLVLQLRLGPHILSDGLLAYLDPRGVLLPLGELMRLLEFPVAVDPVAGTAEGWFLAEDRRFELDLSRGEAVVEGQRSRFDGELAEAHPDDVYVAAELLSRWFPVSFEVDLPTLAIRLAARQKLPFELRLAREALWQRQRGAAEGLAERRFTPREAPFALLGWPRFDASLQAAVEGRRDGTVETTAQHSLLAQGDLLGMSADLFLAGNLSGAGDDPLSDFRLVLSRHDPRGRLLGFLRATELSLGDLASPTDPLISRGRRGRGVQISNAPTVRARIFDRITLRGDAPPGWDLELYRGGSLFDVRKIGDDGRYELLDVPLRFGHNVLRLVLYGPHGEQRETVERIFISAELLPPGETSYRFGVYQQDVGLLRSTADLSPPDEALRGALRLTADVERGLSRSLSVTAGLSSLELGDGRHDYGRLGLRTSLLGAAGRLELIRDSRGGWAGEIGWHRNLGRFSLVAEHTELSSFLSDEIESSELESLSRLRLDGQVRVPGLGTLPLGLTLRHQRRRGGGQLQLRMTASMLRRLGRLQLANRWSLDLAGSRLGVDGNLLVNGRTERLALRGHLSYSLHPAADVSSADVSASWQLRETLDARFGLRHSLAEGLTALTGGLDWELSPLRLGLDLGLASDGSFRAGAGISFSLGRDPRSHQWGLRAGAQARQSAVSARVFLDRNADGRFDDGDEPLPGVAFQTNGSRLDVRTGADGVALLPLASYRHVDLTLDEGSFEDPFWVPEIPGTGFLTRPGVGWTADFPVVATGEVDGTVYLRQGEARRAVANVVLELVGRAGEIVQQVASQYDGFYLFEKVRPGTYSLRVASEQLTRLGFAAPPADEITLDGGEVRSGVDLVLQKTPGPGRPGRAQPSPIH